MDTKTTMDEKDVGLPVVHFTDKDKKSKKSKKSKKRKHSSSGSESDGSPKRLKIKKHKRKCKKKHKHAKDKKHRSGKTCNAKETDTKTTDVEDTIVGPAIPKAIIKKAHIMAPMSKEDWEKKQNTLKRVFDEATGRSRLIRGEGEIVEEIVSRERHQAINRQATQGDGDFFQTKIKKYI